MTFSCLFCDRQFSRGSAYATHQPYCKLNPNRKNRPKSPNAHKKKGSMSWNKGLTKLTHAGIAAGALKLKVSRKNQAPCVHTEETKKRLSEVAKERNFGGYVQGSGRGKKGWYKGYFCDSSWELAYVVYCLDHNIDIKRNVERRQYVWNGKLRNYIPDFIVNGILTEIKGFKTDQWLAKINANPDIRVLYQDDLKNVLDYVKSTYGGNFITLYEK